MVKHLGWVPHTLTAIQKMERTTLSIELLRQLRSIEHHGWKFILTLDELWLYLSPGMSKSGFAEKNNRLKDQGIRSMTKK
jgi:hypothetical protein